MFSSTLYSRFAPPVARNVKKLDATGFTCFHLFSKVQHLQGVITFLITRNVKTVEISRSDVDRYNSSFSIRMANFETLTELCTARKEECPQILSH